MLKHIIPKIPDHKIYVEPFAGALAVLLAKSRSSIEVVNDKNEDLVNFFRYVKWHIDALKDELSGFLQSRADFRDLLQNHGMTDLQRAARWYLIRVASFGAMAESWGRSKSTFHGFDEDRHLAMIDLVHKRIRRVVIECLDWEDVVRFWDSPDTFVYLDPPYATGDAGSYSAFDAATMNRIAEVLAKSKASWILSVDNSDITRKAFSQFCCIPIGIKYSNGPVKEGAKPKPSSELLIFSPQIKDVDKAA